MCPPRRGGRGGAPLAGVLVEAHSRDVRLRRLRCDGVDVARGCRRWLRCGVAIADAVGRHQLAEDLRDGLGVVCVVVSEAQVKLVDGGRDFATPIFAGRFFGLGEDDGGDHVLADLASVGREPRAA